MSLPGRKAPAGAAGIRRWLITVVVSVVSLVLTLTVISLSVGSSLPRTSLYDYLPVLANGLGKLPSSVQHADGGKNDAAIDVPLHGEVLQGGQEPLVEQNGQGGDVNSSERSVPTGTTDSKVPDPVDTGDATVKTDDDSANGFQSAEQGTCDLYHGEWFLDSSGPLYTNNSCPIITQMQNCQGNGRPDKDYENWRWKPEQCTLPHFDAWKFLELMRGKTLAFVGDSVARNQMESLLCILWQEKKNERKGSTAPAKSYSQS